jgi:ABC-type branched-subunit amino acid transport system ATPase component/predicted MFS family arabinose efflux permease
VEGPTDLSAFTADVIAAETETAGNRAGKGISDADLGALHGEELSFRKGLALGGGAFTFGVLLLLNAFDQLGIAAMTVLGPDIGESLGVSDGVIVFMVSASAAFVVLGIVPMGLLADRFKRGPIAAASAFLYGVMALVSGLAVNAFMLFWARFGSGVAQASTIPVNSSLIADTYPIGIRGRLASTTGTIVRLAGVLSPVLVGGIAALFGGADDGGWRWAFIILGVPMSVLALLALRIKEPPRGQWERRSVLGTVPADDATAPVSMEMAFGRLGQIKTVRAMVLAFSAIGFQLFPMLSLTNFFLRDEYGLDAFERGLVTSAGGVLTVVVLPLLGRHFDGVYRTSPARALRIIAFLILPGALLTPIQFNMPNAVLFTILSIPGAILPFAAFSLSSPAMQGVMPYRLRSLGVAYAAIYVFLFGAVGGALLGSAISSSYGERVAIVVLAIPAAVVGAVLVLRGASSIDDDLAEVVASIREENAERERQHADPDSIPMLQLTDIDYSYGNVQVLFGVNIEVARGETLALLGTNGAGKSTILRVVAGLGTPARGAVRLGGRTITFTAPEQRCAKGIQLLPGGKGVFPSLSIAENLEMGAQALPRDLRVERVERVWELFPALRARRAVAASSLSGGQQQQLALGRVLLHDPKILLIDELSLGLSPNIVEELLVVVERLKAQGQTMIIVEQSLNVAMAISDRSVFLEKGTVRFDGSTRELVERDDLARAVFLGDRS